MVFIVIVELQQVLFVMSRWLEKKCMRKLKLSKITKTSAMSEVFLFSLNKIFTMELTLRQIQDFKGKISS